MHTENETVQPWDECGLTQAKYFSLLRAKIREMTFMSALAKPRDIAIKKATLKKKAPDKNGVMRDKSFFECAECKDQFPLYEIVGEKKKNQYYVDHIVGNNSLNSMDDVGPFIRMILATSDKMQLLCKTCHDLKTFMERYQCDKQEAIARKRTIEWLKENNAKQQKEFLLGLGLSDDQTKTLEKRRGKYFNYQLRRLRND